MFSEEASTEKLGVKNALDVIKYRAEFARENPTYFDADGLIVYVGPQGSGKTLSAVKYVYNLMKLYPNAKLVTNLMLKDYPIVTLNEFIKEHYNLKTEKHFDELSDYSQYKIITDYLLLNRVFPFNNSDDLMRYSNDQEGIIYLIDEIQLYFNSLESKNINMDVMTEISQQRKQRKHIVCTSQVFGRLAKPLREQFNCVVSCKNYFKLLQINSYMRQEDITSTDDMKLEGATFKKSIFFHSPADYGRYDTYYKIEKNNFVSEEERVTEIYDKYTINRGE